MLLSNFFCTFAFPVSVYFFIFSLKNKNALFLIISFFRAYKINISTLNRIFKAVIFVTNILLYMIWSNPDRFVPSESAEPFVFPRQLCWNILIIPINLYLAAAHLQCYNDLTDKYSDTDDKGGFGIGDENSHL